MSSNTSDAARKAVGWQPGEHRMVTSEGLRYHVVASGRGPVVVLVAGFPQSCYAWRRVAPLLAEEFTVLAVDLPGQGDSDKPLDGYDTRTTARRLHGLLRTLGREKTPEKVRGERLPGIRSHFQTGACALHRRVVHQRNSASSGGLLGTASDWAILRRVCFSGKGVIESGGARVAAPREQQS